MSDVCSDKYGKSSLLREILLAVLPVSEIRQEYVGGLEREVETEKEDSGGVSDC